MPRSLHLEPLRQKSEDFKYTLTDVWRLKPGSAPRQLGDPLTGEGSIEPPATTSLDHMAWT